MKMTSYLLPDMRTCLWHPKTRAVTYSGHVHVDTPLGDTIITVGKCKFCDEWEKQSDTIASQDGCVGCYGYLSNGMR